MHIVWDWNGTLFDDLAIVVDAVNASLAHEGAGPIDADGYRAGYRRPVHLFYEAILGEPIGSERMAVIDRNFHGVYHASLDRAGLTADARGAIRLVRELGATQSILSMWWHDRLVPAVRAFGLDEFMLAVDGHRGSPGETKEQHLVRHLEQLERLYPGIQDDGVVAIGDITDDASAARAAGVDCVLYDGGSQPLKMLAAEGTPVAFTLVEAVGLAGAGARP
ncbi:HAD family hydrolase [bacterium]|nr:HAD family hydrolase [bacterium]